MRTEIKFKLNDELGSSSAIIMQNETSSSILVLAHGAGAGMTHPFMETLAEQLLMNGIATFRFNFSYMEKGSKRPDSPKKAHAALRSAVNVCKQKTSLPVFLGGKSFGGRMASQLLAEEDIKVKGLIFFGFPLHAPGREGIKRAEHLINVKVPMLFLQGTRDTLAKTELITEATSEVPLANLVFLEGADHSFKTLKRSGIDPEIIMASIIDECRQFINRNI